MTPNETELIYSRLYEIEHLLDNNVYEKSIYKLANTKVLELLNILDGMEVSE